MLDRINDLYHMRQTHYQRAIGSVCYYDHLKDILSFFCLKAVSRSLDFYEHIYLSTTGTNLLFLKFTP